MLDSADALHDAEIDQLVNFHAENVQSCTSRKKPYQVISPSGPQRFIETAPRMMRCTDDLSHGHGLEPKDSALGRRYVRANTNRRTIWQFFDIDREDAAFRFEDANVAVPNAIIQNPANGRAHYAYQLEVPVITSERGRREPQAFLNGVIRGMTRRLDADPGFRNYLAKNPLHDSWRTAWIQKHPYSLHDLAVFLEPEDMQFIREERETVFAEAGRNCSLTSDLAKFALRNGWRYRAEGITREAFIRLLSQHAFDLNTIFPDPLGTGEVLGIARSIGKWAWHESTAEKFSEIQRNRALIRRRRNEAILSEYADLTSARVAEILGCTKRNARNYHAIPREQYEANSLSRLKPWEAMGISRRTYYNRKKAGTL